MHLLHEIVGTYEFAGISCRLECREENFRTLLASRYADFSSRNDVAPEVTVEVKATTVPSDGVEARAAGPFARLGGQGAVLTIEGAGFRGAFDEEFGEGWITQSPDPTALETFLTAICAGRLLKHQGFLLHAAAIMTKEGAYVFFGPSGSGKTTVAELIGEGVITDEITAIRREDEGYVVSAVPWRGQSLTAPLSALFRLRKARETAFSPLSPIEALRQLLPNVFFPRANAREIDRFLEIGGDLAERIPCYDMRFTPDGSFWAAMPRRRVHEHHAQSI
jgi:hypothetical protein